MWPGSKGSGQSCSLSPSPAVNRSGARQMRKSRSHEGEIDVVECAGGRRSWQGEGRRWARDSTGVVKGGICWRDDGWGREREDRQAERLGKGLVWGSSLQACWGGEFSGRAVDGWYFPLGA